MGNSDTEAIELVGEVTADTAAGKGWMLGSMHLCDSCNSVLEAVAKLLKRM